MRKRLLDAATNVHFSGPKCNGISVHLFLTENFSSVLIFIFGENEFGVDLIPQVLQGKLSNLYPSILESSYQGTCTICFGSFGQNIS